MNMISTTTFRKRTLLFLITFLLLSTAIWGAPAALAQVELKADAQLKMERISLAEVIPHPDGGWTRTSTSTQAPVGDVEQFTIALSCGKSMLDGESVTINLSSSALDFSNVTPMLAIDIDGNIFSREVEAKVYKNSIQLTLNMTGLLMNNKARIYIYVEALRTGAGGAITASLTRNNPGSFSASTTVVVGEYGVKKQGSNASALEKPSKTSGMPDADTAYVVSKNNKELVRFYFSNGSLIGLGIRDGSSIAPVEYDVNKKTYVNALNQKPVLPKAEMLDILNTLDFSFLRSPSESKWFSSQPTYSQNVTFDFQ